MTYRFYISEGIKATANNVAQIIGGSTLTRSLFEVFHTKPEKEETRTADEIIDHIKRGLGE